MYPHPIALSTEIVHVAIHLSSVLVTKTKLTAISMVLIRPHKLKSTFLENSANLKLIDFFLYYLYNVPTLYLSAYEAKKRNEKQEEERV